MDTLPRSAWAQHYVLFAQALKEEGAPLWGFTARKPRQSRIITRSYVMLGYFSWVGFRDCEEMHFKQGWEFGWVKTAQTLFHV